MYPSNIIQNNIAPNTQIGKIDIPNQVYENENAYHNDKYTRSGEFIENMMTDNPIEFCRRWFGLAGIPEFLEDMKEYSSHYKYGAPYSRFVVRNGKVLERAVYDTKTAQPKEEPRKLKNPIYKLSNLGQSGMPNDFDKIKDRKDNKDGDNQFD